MSVAGAFANLLRQHDQQWEDYRRQQMLQEERRRIARLDAEKRDQAARDLGMRFFSENPTANVRKILPSLGPITAQTRDFLEEYARLQKQKMNQAEQMQQAGAASGRAAALGAGTLNQKGGITPPTDPERAAYSREVSALQGMVPPEQRAQALNALGSTILDKQAAMREAIARARFATNEGLRSDLVTRGRMGREDLVNGLAMSLAATEGPVDTQAAANQLMQAGFSPEEALRKSREIPIRVAEARAKRVLAATGVSDRQASAEALANELATAYPEFAALPAGRQTDIARLVSEGNAVIDPVLLELTGKIHVEPTGNATLSTAYRKRRDAELEMYDKFNEFQQANDNLGQAIAEGRIPKQAPFFAEGIARIQKEMGTLPPELARYQNDSFIFISAFLKATQGSRPSDFDMAMFMALRPALTEVGTASGAARMKSLQALVDGNVQRSLTKQEKSEFQSIRRKTGPVKKKMQAMLREYGLTGDLAGDTWDQMSPLKKQEVLDKLDRMAQEMQRTGERDQYLTRAQKQVIYGDQALDDKDEALLNQVGAGVPY